MAKNKRDFYGQNTQYFKEQNAKFLDPNTSYSDYDYEGAKKLIQNQIESFNKSARLFQKAGRYNDLFTQGLALDMMDVAEANINNIKTVYDQKLKEKDEGQKLEAQKLAAQEQALKQQEAARAKAAAEKQKQISLLGQKDLTGVAKEYGTTDLTAAAEIKRQREENARKQEQSEKIDASSLRIARGQRGRRGTATGTQGGRGFFERYFQ
jgi:hypothetical protein